MKSNQAWFGRLAILALTVGGFPLLDSARGADVSYTVTRDALSSGGGRSTSASYSELGELNAVGAADRSVRYESSGGFVGGEPGEPEIVVGALVDGLSTVDFGLVTSGCSCGAKTFTIENVGGTELKDLAITKDGPNAADFTISDLSGTKLPAGKKAVIFTVNFSPSTSGVRTASIHIANNTPGARSSFDIALMGTGSDSTVTTGPDTIERPNTSSVVKVLLSKLLENDTDSSGGALSITSVGDAQPAGASVTLVGGFAVYAAPSATAGDGSFTYTLCGAPGGKPVVGTVTVKETGTVTETEKPEDTGPDTHGGRIEVKHEDVVLTYIGVPFRTYRLQYTTDTGVPYTWNEFDPPVLLVAPNSGVISYTDVNPSGPLRFYRFLLKR